MFFQSYYQETTKRPIPFYVTGLFLYPLKTSENLSLSFPNVISRGVGGGHWYKISEK